MTEETPDGEEIDALNDALRRVISSVRTSQAPAHLLRAAREALDEIDARLAPHSHPGPYAQHGLNGGAPNPTAYDDPMRQFPYSPVIGSRNPVAPPLEFEFRDGVMHGRGTVGAPYTGPPGAVHGGIVALMLDELLGAANTALEVGAYTGTLTIRYLAPTPVGVPLRMEARHTRSDGRKVYAEGSLWAGDVLTAKAEGTFIRPRVPLLQRRQAPPRELP